MVERSFPGLVACAVDPDFEESFEVVFKKGRTAAHIVFTQSTNSRVYVLWEIEIVSQRKLSV